MQLLKIETKNLLISLKMDQLMGHVNVAIAGFVALITDPIFGKFFIASNVISLICWLATIATDNYSHVIKI